MNGPDSIYDVLLRDYLFKLSQRGWQEQVNGVLTLAEYGEGSAIPALATMTFDNNPPASVPRDYTKQPKKPKALRGRP